MKKGFTIIEVVIATFVIGVVFVGVFGFITLTIKSAHDGERKIIATALANEKMEMIRNLPYDSVGTVGGIPSGPIAQEEEVVRNGASYRVYTDIRYYDDPFDGTVSDDPPDLLNIDYKIARVEVSWESNFPPNRSVLLITHIAPRGIEGGESLGTLVFQALDALGAGVAGATVRLVNDAVSPAVDLETQTDDTGTVLLPGLIPSSGTYRLSVSKDGYTSEQTYDTTESFIPDVDHSHITAIGAQITNKTFFIDRQSSLTIQTKDDEGESLGDVGYTITGTKKIGTDAAEAPVYLLNEQASTDASGVHEYENVTWDAYSFSVDGDVTGYDIKETSAVLPLVVNPGEDVTLDVTLVPHEPYSLHVTVIDPNNNPISNASVHVTREGYDSTLSTGEFGQVFFDDLHGVGGQYSVEVTAEGYEPNTQTVDIDGTTRITIQTSSV